MPTKSARRPSRYTMSRMLGGSTTMRDAFRGTVTRRPRSSTIVSVVGPVGFVEFGLVVLFFGLGAGGVVDAAGAGVRTGWNSKYAAVPAIATPATTSIATTKTAGAMGGFDT